MPKIEAYEWVCSICKKKIIAVSKETIEEEINKHLERHKKELEDLKRFSREDLKIISKILIHEKVVNSLKRLMKKYNITIEELKEILDEMEYVDEIEKGD